LRGFCKLSDGLEPSTSYLEEGQLVETVLDFTAADAAPVETGS